MSTIRMRWIARMLILLWACWWTFFVLAGAIGEGGGWQKALLPTLLATSIFFCSALFAWRWEAGGSGLLVVEGLLVCAAYPVGFLHAHSIGTMIFVLLTLAAPPLVSGFLFFRSWRRTRTSGTA